MLNSLAMLALLWFLNAFVILIAELVVIIFSIFQICIRFHG